MGYTKEKRLINKMGGSSKVQKQTPIATDMFIPNHSGDNSAGFVKAPTSDLDIANKKYVDDHMTAIPDLQDVTDVGATTTNDVTTSNLTISGSGGTGSKQILMDGDNDELSIKLHDDNTGKWYEQRLYRSSSSNRYIFRYYDTSTTKNIMTFLNGNVGINNFSPSSQLDIVGNTKITTGDLIVDGTNYDLFVDNSTGKVGIGTSSPTYKLDVVGDIGMSAKLYHNDDSDTYLEYTTNVMSFYQGGQLTHDESLSSGFRINPTSLDVDTKIYTDSGISLFVNGANGNVGIGTTVPTQKLEVNGNIEQGFNWTGYDTNNHVKSLYAGGATFTEASQQFNLYNRVGYSRGWEWNKSGTNVLSLNIDGTMILSGIYECGTGYFRPTGDDATTLGSISAMWKEFYTRNAHMGTITNFTSIEDDGTLVFNGDARVFKDINMGSAQLSKPASSAPGTDEFKDNTGVGTDTGIETLAFAVGEKVSGSFEIQHDYKEGSDITFHVHWQGIDPPTGTDKVKWQLIYCVARDGVVLSTTTTINTETDFDTQWEFARSDFTAITGTNFLIGDQFLFQLSRIAASADSYVGEALLATAGIHYEVDTVGSRTITSK